MFQRATTRLNKRMFILPSPKRITLSSDIFCLVWFYGISTIIGYFMLNPFYTYKQLCFKQFSLAEVHSLNGKNCLFQIIQSRISRLFNSIWPTDRNQSDATTPGQSGPKSDGNKGVFCIPQNISSTRVSPLDCLIQDSRWRSLTLLQRCRRCILQPQPTEPIEQWQNHTWILEQCYSQNNKRRRWLFNILAYSKTFFDEK